MSGEALLEQAIGAVSDVVASMMVRLLEMNDVDHGALRVLAFHVHTRTPTHGKPPVRSEKELGSEDRTLGVRRRQRVGCAQDILGAQQTHDG